MKKILVLALTVVMIMMFLNGCSETNIEEKNSSQDVQAEENSIINTETNIETDTMKETKSGSKVESPVELSETYVVPMRAIVIDVPAYQPIEKGYTKLFIMHGQKCIALTAHKDSDATELMDAHQDAVDLFIRTFENYDTIVSLTAEEDEYVEINGVSMYRYEGVFNCSDAVGDHTDYVVGYSFIKDGVPCTLLGCVLDESQPEEMKKEIEATVDAVIQTLRSEE